MGISNDIEKLEQKRNNIKFIYLLRVCQEYFGNPRINGGHHIFKTPWMGDPRINLQKQRGDAKSYQVDQVVEALQKLREIEESRKNKLKSKEKGE